MVVFGWTLTFCRRPLGVKTFNTLIVIWWKFVSINVIKSALIIENNTCISQMLSGMTMMFLFSAILWLDTNCQIQSMATKLLHVNKSAQPCQTSCLVRWHWHQTRCTNEFIADYALSLIYPEYLQVLQNLFP